jgi:small subunit ribosomal protein S9
MSAEAPEVEEIAEPETTEVEPAEPAEVQAETPAEQEPEAEAAEPPASEEPQPESDGEGVAPASEPTGDEEPAPVAPYTPPSGRVQATGKRKSSIARVVVEPGDGTITVHGRSLEDYFGRQTLVAQIRQPLVLTGADGHYRITARLVGGGVGGQAGALRHAIARALIKLDENLRPALKREGFLTRDARVKERKKAGLKGARKRPQFSKR